MAKKKERVFLTNISKDKVTESLKPFVKEEAFNLKGESLPNHSAVYTKPTIRARALVLSALSPKTWIKFLLRGSKKKNQKK